MPKFTVIEQAGIAQLARASAFQAEGRGLESRFPLHRERSVSGLRKSNSSSPVGVAIERGRGFSFRSIQNYFSTLYGEGSASAHVAQ